MSGAVSIIQALDDFLSQELLGEVFFAGDRTRPPVLSYVVNFPRLTAPLSGVFETEIEQVGKPVALKLSPGQAVFAPPNCWNKPTWRKAVKTISFLFGRRQTGISLVECSGGGEESLRADKMAINSPLSGPAQKILQALLELRATGSGFSAFPQLVDSLLHSCRELMRESNPAKQRKAFNLLQNVCAYLQENFQHDINRESVAGQFQITPNHLSRLFKTEGSMKFNDYLTYVRVDRAKFMLGKYDMTLKEIALRCGYPDLGYFCRVFKNIVHKTPTQYKHLYRAKS